MMTHRVPSHEGKTTGSVAGQGPVGGSEGRPLVLLSDDAPPPCCPARSGALALPHDRAPRAHVEAWPYEPAGATTLWAQWPLDEPPRGQRRCARMRKLIRRPFLLWRRARRRDPLDDGALLARIGRGDRAALALFYDRHAAAAYSVAVGLVGETEAADAAVEEAFRRVWRAPGRWSCVPGALPLVLLVSQAVFDARHAPVDLAT